MLWDDLNTEEDFKNWVTGQAEFTFKVGVFNTHREFFNGVGNFFHKFVGPVPKAKTDPSISTPIGQLNFRNLDLDPGVIFETSTNKFRQGDLISLDQHILPCIAGAPDYWMLTSHSCDIENRPFVTAIPGYLYPNLEKQAWAMNVNPQNLGNISENKIVRFLSLPPNMAWGDEPLIFDISLPHPFGSKLLTQATKVISLSLGGLFYMQNRMSIAIFRDVRDTDDARTLRG